MLVSQRRWSCRPPRRLCASADVRHAAWMFCRPSALPATGGGIDAPPCRHPTATQTSPHLATHRYSNAKHPAGLQTLAWSAAGRHGGAGWYPSVWRLGGAWFHSVALREDGRLCDALVDKLGRAYKKAFARFWETAAGQGIAHMGPWALSNSQAPRRKTCAPRVANRRRQF